MKTRSPSALRHGSRPPRCHCLGARPFFNIPVFFLPPPSLVFKA